MNTKGRLLVRDTAYCMG